MDGTVNGTYVCELLVILKFWALDLTSGLLVRLWTAASYTPYERCQVLLIFVKDRGVFWWSEYWSSAVIFNFFRISQGSVATHLMQAKNLNQTHTEFTGESVSEGFRKSVYVCRSYDLKSSVPFLPRDTVLARYMLSSRVLPSVCVSVRYTPVLCQNGWT